MYSRMDQVNIVEESFYKNLKLYGLLRPYQLNFFKGLLPQISLGPFLNTLSHMLHCSEKKINIC